MKVILFFINSSTLYRDVFLLKLSYFTMIQFKKRLEEWLKVVSYKTKQLLLILTELIVQNKVSLQVHFLINSLIWLSLQTDLHYWFWK